MDSHNDLLGELAADAALERSDFIVQATEQLRRFLDHHSDRIAAIGGLTLIDDEPDYLSIAPDLSFRSRSRYLDDVTGEWVSETEVIESAAELVELYNPADIYAAFAEAAREAAGMHAEPTAEGDLIEVAGISAVETLSGRLGEDPYAAAADSWAAGQAGPRSMPRTTSRPRLACTTSRSSTRSAASAARRACSTSSRGVGRAGRGHRRPDHRRRRRRAAVLTATAVPCRGHPRGRRRRVADPRDADELVEFYDPTDVFGDLADALAEAFPSVAPELATLRTAPRATARSRRGRRRDRRGRDDGDDADAAEDEPTA